MMHERACCCDEAAYHQLPIAEAFWIIQIVSTEECWSLMQILIQICCSVHSVILNAMATQYTCSLNGIYPSTNPHWLVQWSHYCSLMPIPVHSPWLPGYIVVTQTILVILTMVGLFPDRHYTHTHTYIHKYTHLEIIIRFVIIVTLPHRSRAAAWFSYYKNENINLCPLFLTEFPELPISAKGWKNMRTYHNYYFKIYFNHYIGLFGLFLGTISFPSNTIACDTK